MDRIKRVEGLDRWLVRSDLTTGFALFGEPRLVRKLKYQSAFFVVCDNTNRNDMEIVKRLSSMKIGEVGSYWDTDLRIEYEYAKIKLGDVFNYYTSGDGTLQVPAWSCFKLAVDEYLESNPRR